MSGAGDLRDQIIIEEPAEQKESQFGGMRSTWETFTERNAFIEPMGGRETWRAQQVQPELTHRIRIYYTAGVTSKMRVKFDDKKGGAIRYFGISAVLNPDRMWMHLHCIEEVGADG